MTHLHFKTPIREYEVNYYSSYDEGRKVLEVKVTIYFRSLAIIGGGIGKDRGNHSGHAWHEVCLDLHPTVKGNFLFYLCLSNSRTCDYKELTMAQYSYGKVLPGVVVDA